MATNTSAPWAEPVLLTTEDLAALPDDTWRYELVEGRLVRMPPTGFEHSDVGWNLLAALGGFVDSHGLGRVTLPETGFVISRPGEPDTVLAPDIAFVSAARAPEPGSPDWIGFPRLAPDLVVEIASPSQRQPDLAAKALLWLRAGARLVWVIWPRERHVDIWKHGLDVPDAILTEGDQLDGGEILPGFTFPVAHLFR